MRYRLAAVIGFLVGCWWTSPALADDVEARLSQSGMGFLAAEVPAYLPTSLAFGGGTLFSTGCLWGDDFNIGVSGVSVSQISYGALKLGTSGGKVTATLDATNIKASGKLNVTHSLCVAGDLSCDFEVTAAKARVTASMTPRIQGQRVELVQPSISSTVSPVDVTINVKNCGLAGEILDKVESVLHSWFVGQLQTWLEDMAETELPPELENLLSSFTSIGGAAQGYEADATLRDIDALGDGLHISAGLSLTATSSASCTQAALPSAAKSGSAAPVFNFKGEHLGVALSEATVKNAFVATWKAGFLCYPYSTLKTMGWNDQLMDGAGVLLGLQSVASVDANAPNPPTLKLVAGTPGRAEVAFAGFQAVIKGQGPSGPVTITATTDVAMDAEIGVHGENRSVSLVDAETTLSNLKLDVDKPEGLTISEVLFRDILDDVILPVVESKIAGLELLPHVFNAGTGELSAYYLYLTRSITSGSFAYLYANLHKKDPADKTAPNTTIVTKPGGVLKPQLFKILAEGTDNSTPAELLRFKWKAGTGGAGSWSGATYGRARTVELVHGKNVIEAKAVDLGGNTDGSPARIELEVDGKPPTLTVEPPPALIDIPELRLSFAVSDDHTPASEIKVMLQLKHEAEAGREEVVREDPFIKGVQAVELRQLVRGRYTVTLVAEDGVGNKCMPQSHTFEVDVPEGTGGNPDQPGGQTSWDPAPDAKGGVTGGCQLVAVQAAPPLPLLLFALWAVARRRRSQ